VKAHRYLVESYLQDTWKASRRVTLDYGVRSCGSSPGIPTCPRRPSCRTGTTVPGPALYQPARINNQNVALDPVTGEVRPNPYVGSFVPGTGDPYNGMVRSSDPDYPKASVTTRDHA